MPGLLWEKSPPETDVFVTHCVLALELILLPLGIASAPVGPSYSTLEMSLESREKYDFLPPVLSLEEESPAPRPEELRPEEGQGWIGLSAQSSIRASGSVFCSSPQGSSPLRSRCALLSSTDTLPAPPSLLFSRSRSPCFGESGPSESESRLPRGEAERLGEEERLSWSMSRPLLKLLLLFARLPTTELLLPWDWPSSLSLSRDWLTAEVGGGTAEGAKLSAVCVDVGGFEVAAES